MSVTQTPAYSSEFIENATLALFACSNLEEVKKYFQSLSLFLKEGSDPEAFLFPQSLEGRGYFDQLGGAIKFAFQAHQCHTRKGNVVVPYVAHLLDVAAATIIYGGDVITVIVALLHDCVEDVGVKEYSLIEVFGSDIASLVMSLTETDQFPKPPKRQRKELYLANIASHNSLTALVSCCDKLSNMYDYLDGLNSGNFIPDKETRELNIWFLGELLKLYTQKLGQIPLTTEFGGTYNELVVCWEHYASQTGN